MKKNEIKVGGLYSARVSGRYVTVRVDDIRDRLAFKGVSYYVTNLDTGRKTVFHSAAKFRSSAEPEAANKRAANAGIDAMGVADPTLQVSESESSVDSLDMPVMQAEVDEVISGLEYTLKDLEEDRTTPPTTEDLEDAGLPTKAEGEQCADPMPALAAVTGLLDGTTVQSATETCAQNATVSENATANAGFAKAIAQQTPSTSVNLTAEQEAILATAREIEAARGNGQRVLVIGAGAGCGKTHSLRELEKVLHGNGQYTAFNSSLVAESKAKFKRAACNTTHSLAFRAVGKQFAHRLNGPRVRSYEIAQRLGIADFTVELPEVIAPKGEDGKPKLRTIKAGYLAGQLVVAIRRFCQSADAAIGPQHFRRFDGIDAKGESANSNRVRDYLLPFAQVMWSDLSDTNGTMPFSHDVYVKLWQLGQGNDRPVIAADYILLDEAQDTAPVMLDILQQQKHALLILVGDDNQQIYEWRGAVNAMATFPNAPRRLLSQSFRFGQVIADVANSILAELDEPTDLVMKGLPSIPSRVCAVAEPRCYLYRTNAGAVGKLMRAMEEGKSGHLIGGTKETIEFCKAAVELQQKRPTQHPELGCFSNWSEVQAYSKEDEGQDLRLMVKLIDDFGADNIRDALEDMPAEKDADLILSTAHRSKGREWASVQLGADFPTANKMNDADRRLLYVACTRAQEELDISKCPTFCGGYDRSGCGGDGGEMSAPEWIPGIEIEYTAPMPTPEQLATYRQNRTECPALASNPNKQQSPSPEVKTATAANVGNGNGNGASGEFTWANLDGKWLVRGTAGMENQIVIVTRKNGTKSKERLGRVVRTIGDKCFYQVG